MPPTESQHATPETAIAVMSRDIHYMKESLMRLETLFTEASKNNLLRSEFETYKENISRAKAEEDRDFNNYKAETIKCSDDHEKRLREIETTVTRIVTWGTAGVLLLGIAEFLINKFL